MVKLLIRLTNTPLKAVALASFLLFFVGYLDYATGYEVALSFFYLLPVLIVGWRINLRASLLFSVLSAVLWGLNDSWFIFHPYSHPITPYWNALVRLMFFAAFSVLNDYNKSFLKKEQAQSALKSSMMHTVSHEFNNSLTVLSSGLFLLRETEPEPGNAMRAKILSAMDATRHQMSSYIKNILNEARMEAGKFKLEKTSFALRELVQEFTAPMRIFITTKGLALEIKLPESPVFISADRDAMALIVSNLLANAIKYTPGDGRIIVSVTPRGEPVEKVVFSVEDTGIGISLADIDKLTTDFYRTEAGKKTAEGFGLGLKITNELLNLHGSRLEIFSEKGKGSRFFFELPVLPPHYAETTEKANNTGE